MKKKIKKIISKSDDLILRKYYNHFKYNADNLIIKQIMNLIRSELRKRKREREPFTRLRIDLIERKGANEYFHQSHNIEVESEELLNYSFVKNTIDKYLFHLQYSEEQPIFEGIGEFDNVYEAKGNFIKNGFYKIMVEKKASMLSYSDDEEGEEEEENTVSSGKVLEGENSITWSCSNEENSNNSSISRNINNLIDEKKIDEELYYRQDQDLIDGELNFDNAEEFKQP